MLRLLQSAEGLMEEGEIGKTWELYDDFRVPVWGSETIPDMGVLMSPNNSKKANFM